MDLFLLGVLVGAMLWQFGKDAYRRVTFLFLLSIAERRRKQEIKDGISKLEKHINAQDWSDDD